MKIKTIYSRLKKNLLMAITVLAVVATNILIWIFFKTDDSQIIWVGFILVWVDLLIAAITNIRQPYIAKIFLIIAMLIEFFLIANNFWIQNKVL